MRHIGATDSGHVGPPVICWISPGMEGDRRLTDPGADHLDAELGLPARGVAAQDAQHHERLAVVDDPVDIEEQERFHYG